MSTKGPSIRYTKTVHAKQLKNEGKKATINFDWAKGFNKNTLSQHFRDHGAQMNCSTKTAYAAHAVNFANTIDKVNCRSFVDKGGSTYKYNVKTDELAIIDKKGYVITYFKPKSGYNYYKKAKEEAKK